MAVPALGQGFCRVWKVGRADTEALCWKRTPWGGGRDPSTPKLRPRGQGRPAVLTDSLKFCTVSKAQRSQVIKILSLQAKNSSRFMPHVGESCLAWLLPLGKRSNLASISSKAGAHRPGFPRSKGARAPHPHPMLTRSWHEVTRLHFLCNCSGAIL